MAAEVVFAVNAKKVYDNYGPRSFRYICSCV